MTEDSSCISTMSGYRRDDMIGLYEELIKMKDAGEPAMMVTVVEMTGNTPVAVGKKMLVGESGTTFGTVGGGAIELFATNKCKELIKKRVSMTEKYVLNEGKNCGKCSVITHGLWWCRNTIL